VGDTAAIAALSSSSDELGQVLALLRAAAEPDPEALEVAAGDRRLLALHRALTGRDVEVAIPCSRCEELSVVVLGPDTVPDHAPRTAWLGPGGGLRGPTYGDLLALPDDPRDAADELLRRCTIGTPPRPAGADDLERIDDSLTGPVTTACVECGTPLEAAVDVERLILDSLQRHLLEVELEVHLLARAYGWDLGTIETLPDERRRRLARLVADER
jgi:hypothetical protein